MHYENFKRIEFRFRNFFEKKKFLAFDPSFTCACNAAVDHEYQAQKREASNQDYFATTEVTYRSGILFQVTL